MARHDQKPDKALMTCPPCKKGQCEYCVDVIRSVYTDIMICECTRKNHSGEAVDQQVVDPFTDTVHAPGLTVSKDGEVTYARDMPPVSESD